MLPQRFLNPQRGSGGTEGDVERAWCKGPVHADVLKAKGCLGL